MLSIDTFPTLLAADSTHAVPPRKKTRSPIFSLGLLTAKSPWADAWSADREEILQSASGNLKCTSALDWLSLCEPSGRVYTWSWQWSLGCRSSMILAAVLRTLCSGANVVMGRPLRVASRNSKRDECRLLASNSEIGLSSPPSLF